MKQTEARFKSKIKECFKEAFQHTDVWMTSIVASLGQQAGIPDLFLAAGGEALWVEAKYGLTASYPIRQQRAQAQLAAAAGRSCPVALITMVPGRLRVYDQIEVKVIGRSEPAKRCDPDRMKQPLFWTFLMNGEMPE